MITTINNKHKKLNFSSEREQSQACLNSAEHEKNQGRKVLNVPNLRFPEFQGEWEKCKLGDVMNFSTTRVNSSELNEDNYVSTENMLQDYQGIVDAKSVPEDVNVISFSCGDTLISNIRPYLKKVWKATYNGGCSSDVFVLKANDNIESDYLHYVIANDKFINFVMSGAKGVKMPRGDKNQMKTYSLSLPQIQEQKKIGKMLSLLDERIATQNKIIDKLQSLIKGIRNDVFGKFRKNVGVNAMVGDVLSYEQPQPYIVEDTEYTAEGIPVLTANKAFVLGYTSETDGIYDKGDCIIFDDFTLDCKYVDFPFKVKSSAIKILTAKDKELLRYTFEFMKYLDLSTDEHKRHYIAETQNQELFLPTAQVVRTIAHAFSALSSRMKTVTKQRDMFELQPANVLLVDYQYYTL